MKLTETSLAAIQTYTAFINRMNEIIDKPTHKDGHILDHLYLRDIDIAEWKFHHPYYSDHDAICIRANF